MPTKLFGSDYVLVGSSVFRQRVEMMHQSKVSFLKVGARTRTYKKSYTLLIKRTGKQKRDGNWATYNPL